MANWVDFQMRLDFPERKTRVWDVISAGSEHVTLGKVQWFPKWRRYAFFPETNMVFDQHCLMDIALFCEKENQQRKEHGHN